MNPEFYTQAYDAISTAIHAVLPNIKFVGCALAQGFNMQQWMGYFLNSSNHAPAAPAPEYVSFHFYASANSRTDPSQFETFFTQVDQSLIPTVEQFYQVKSQQSSNVKLDLDELGVILPNDNVNNPQPFPLIYWNAAGAMYAYIYGLLSSYNVDILGESQMVGYPTQFPSVSMVNWTSGEGTARYWILKLLIDNFNGKTPMKLYQTSNSDTSDTFAQAYITSDGVKKLLFINKKDSEFTISLPSSVTSVQYVDLSTGFGPYATEKISSTSFVATNFGVYIFLI